MLSCTQRAILRKASVIFQGAKLVKLTKIDDVSCRAIDCLNEINAHDQPARLYLEVLIVKHFTQGQNSVGVYAMDQIKEQERWMISFYRHSEITGAMFFGKIAACMPAGPIQANLNKHFADESMHSWYWTKAMQELDYKPIRITDAYQDAYLDAGGLPVNMMEILALTNVFEKRVIRQYVHHMKLPNLNPVMKETFEKIVEDEKWHVYWINQALKDYAEKYGEDRVNEKIQHYKKADEEVYKKFVDEHQQRIGYVFGLSTDC